MAYAAIVVAVIGAVASIAQANAAKKQQQDNANLNVYNAQLDQNRANVALAQSNAQEEAQRREIAQRQGALRGALAQTGFDSNSGASLDVYEQSATNGELEALTTRYQGILTAQGQLDQEGADVFKANAANQNASTVQRAGYLSAAGAAASGYGNGLKFSNSLSS